MNNDSPCICFAVPPLFSKEIGKSWILHPQMGGKDLSNHHQMPPALAPVTNGLSPSLKSLAGQRSPDSFCMNTRDGTGLLRRRRLLSCYFSVCKASLCSSGAPTPSQALPNEDCAGSLSHSVQTSPPPQSQQRFCYRFWPRQNLTLDFGPKELAASPGNIPPGHTLTGTSRS